MTLKQKIVVLISFMLFVSLVVFCWFMGRLSQHRIAFAQTMNADWKKLEAKQDAAISDLNEKRGDLVKENISDIKSMEEGVRAHIEDDKKFNETFIERQNEVFGKIERFNLKGKK